MSTNNDITKISYRHLSEVERGKIEGFLSESLKPADEKATLFCTDFIKCFF